MNKYFDFFKEVDFKPMFFLKSGGEIVKFNEFKDFIENKSIEEYLNEENKYVSEMFLRISIGYCIFFECFYKEEDLIFKKNFNYLIDYSNKYFDEFKDLFPKIQEDKISQKWYDILTKYFEMENNIKKVLMTSLITSNFVNELTLFSMKWLPDNCSVNFFYR